MNQIAEDRPVMTGRATADARLEHDRKKYPSTDFQAWFPESKCFDEITTQRKQAQDLLEQTVTTLEQHEFHFELVNDSVMTRTMEGRINFWNHSAEDLYGWRKEEAIGRISHDLLQTRFPKPLEEIESELVRNGRWEGKLVHTTRDGGRVVVESRWSLDPEGQFGAVVEINTRSTDADGRTSSESAEIATPEPLPNRAAKADRFLLKFANVVLAGGALFCLLALSYFVYYYGWTGQRQFSSWLGVLVYYVFPALLAILLLASLRMDKSHRINLALLLFSSAVCIYGLESLLSVWSNLPSVTVEAARRKRVAAAQALGIEFDPRTKTQVVDDLRRQGMDAVVSVFPDALLQEQTDGTSKSLISIDGLEVLPLAGLADKLVVVCNENGQFFTYRSDQHGFNNPQRVWQSPVDIVALGDSFTQGWCVAADLNFVSLIRQRVPGTLNLGVDGNGPLTMLATLREYAETVKPKLVLWFYYDGNDLRNLSKERKSPLLSRYVKTNEFRQNLSNRQAEIDRAVAAYLDSVTNKNRLLIKLDEISAAVTNLDKLPGGFKNIAKLTQLRQRVGLVYGVAATNSNEELGELPSKYLTEVAFLSEVLLRAKDLVSQWGGKLYFVYLPGGGRYMPGREVNTERYMGRDAVLQTVNKVGLPLIDLHPALKQQRDPLALFALGRPGLHYNEAGHRLVAEEVLRALPPVQTR